MVTTDAAKTTDSQPETISQQTNIGTETNSESSPRPTPHIDVKLFIGRIPPTTDEETLRPLFAKYGTVLEVVILKDKTSNHKGSAFVRMESITAADAAIRELHNTSVIEPSSGPIQISYANGEYERLGFTQESLPSGQDEAKVFLNFLPKDVTEEQLENFLKKFGTIKSVFLMKTPATGKPKGHGFATFANKEEALLAIRQLHGQVTFPSGVRPMEARIAAPKRTSTDATTMKLIQPTNTNPRQAGLWKEYFAPDGCPYYHNDQLGLTQWEIPQEFLTAELRTRPGGTESADITGPLGANVFIFHVPNEWRKEDLAAYFAPFGYILSAKVAIDKITGRNKGYGFVSYDNIRSALQAVQEMNLVSVENKRLRVAIKSGEEEYARQYAAMNEPYQLSTGYPQLQPYGRYTPGAARPGLPYQPGNPIIPHQPADFTNYGLQQFPANPARGTNPAVGAAVTGQR